MYGYGMTCGAFLLLLLMSEGMVPNINENTAVDGADAAARAEQEPKRDEPGN